MYELAVLLVGAGFGIGAHARRLKPWSPMVCVMAFVVGFVAAFASGELAESWAFVLFDAAEAWAAAIGAALLASRCARRFTAA